VQQICKGPRPMAKSCGELVVEEPMNM